LSTDGIILNKVFTKILGTSSPMNLSLVGYQGLAGGNVSLGDLVAADPSLGTPSQLLSTPVSVKRLAQASVTALNNKAAGGDTAAGTAATPLGTFASTIDSGLMVKLGDVLAFDQPDGVAAAGAQLNAFDLITTGAEKARIANNTNLISIPNLEINPINGLPVISNLVTSGTGTTLAMTIIEAPRLSALGPARCPSPAPAPCVTYAQTAQISLKLTTRVGIGTCPGLICAADIVLPIDISAAKGVANLTAVTCANPISASQVYSRVDTDGASVKAIGPSVSLLSLPVAAPALLGPVNLVSGSTPLTFTGPFPSARQSTSAQSVGLVPLVSALLPIVGLVTAPILNATMGQIESVLLGPVLKGLGISIAGADVRAMQVRCGVPTLVE
ncbi:MAG: hypothetical protein ACRDRT_03965, partial [Pseudonocardiaceae bacterium]